jgi:hypothetical protein
MDLPAQALIFGAKYSPCCAIYYLQAAATDGQGSYDAINTLFLMIFTWMMF